MNERDEDRIEISLNDLEQKDAQPADDRLVITSNDLLDVPDTPVMPTIPSTLGGQMSGIGGAVPMAKSAAGRFAISTMLQNLIAGAIGGFLAWALQEPFFNESTGTHFAHVLMEMGIVGGIMGALIGVALGSVESILNHLAERALIGAAIGLGVGFGGGFLGGVVGQLVYSGLGGGGASSMGQQIMARSIGWAVVGTFVGLGQGIAIRSSRKIVNGLLGGLIGGAIGGVMFDLIGMMVGGGAASRAFAITATGACAGAAIGLVEELRKQAWLNVVQGWLAGKQFIIYKDSTIIGSSPKCDIPIFKDPQVLPQHALIRAENGRYSVHSLQSGAAIYVNQQPVSCRVLRNGDVITIGGTTFSYNEKALDFQPRQHMPGT